MSYRETDLCYKLPVGYIACLPGSGSIFIHTISFGCNLRFCLFILCSVIASKACCAHLHVDCRSLDEQMSILSMKIHLFLSLPDCELNLRKVTSVYLNNFSDVVNTQVLFRWHVFSYFILKRACEAINTDQVERNQTLLVLTNVCG